MGRRAKDRRQTGPKPVEKVELSEKHLGRRFAAFLACLAVGLSAIGYGVYTLATPDPGWVTIEAGTGSANCAMDFDFRYYLDGVGLSASDQQRQATRLYSDLVVKAYQLFTPAAEVEDVHNLWYINQHPGEDIEVDPVLYQAFETAAAYGDRSVYLGPVYSQYSDLLYCQDDADAYYFDPFENPEAEAFCREAAAFAADPLSVDVKLLGENRLRLEISEEYKKFAGECGGLPFLDFAWQTNAYIIDYFAQCFQEQGLTNGEFTSVDGYSRSLLPGQGRSLLTLYAWEDGQDVEAAAAQLPTGLSLVNLRSFPLGDQEGRYYVMGDGSIRHQYVDISDGFCRTSAQALTVYAPDKTCAQLMLEAAPLFVAGELDRQGLLRLEGTESIVLVGREFLYSEAGLELGEFYRGYTAVKS